QQLPRAARAGHHRRARPVGHHQRAHPRARERRAQPRRQPLRVAQGGIAGALAGLHRVEHWGAVYGRIRHWHGLNLREALATLPAGDVAALIADANRREDQAARDAENLAMIVDRLNFEMTFDYVGAVTDPDDPEVKRDRALRAKHGIGAPPLPIVAPVAQRP